MIDDDIPEDLEMFSLRLFFMGEDPFSIMLDPSIANVSIVDNDVASKQGSKIKVTKYWYKEEHIMEGVSNLGISRNRACHLSPVASQGSILEKF